MLLLLFPILKIPDHNRSVTLMNLENILNAAIGRESFCIPKQAVITGSLKTDTPGQIAGIINGDVLANSKIAILKDGIVNGDVSAEELIVFGKINGNVNRCNKMIVQSGAIIKGNITTIEIHIEKDAVIEGVVSKAGVHMVIHKKKEPLRKNESATEHSEMGSEEKSETIERQTWF
jgi:cytoskeletal protein CcmA (bactofilin family)